MKLEELKNRLLKNPKFRKEYNKKDPAFQFGMFILHWRIMNGYSLKRLSKLIGLSERSIERLENGEKV